MTKYRWFVDQLIAGWGRVRYLSTAHRQIEAMQTFSFPVRLESGLATLKLNLARLWQAIGFPRFFVQFYPAVQLGFGFGFGYSHSKSRCFGSAAWLSSYLVWR